MSKVKSPKYWAVPNPNGTPPKDGKESFMLHWIDESKDPPQRVQAFYANMEETLASANGRTHDLKGNLLK